MIHVLTTAYNCAAYLDRCLDSVAAQEGPDFICWVFDDVSTDGTHDVIRSRAARDPRFRHARRARHYWQLGNYDDWHRRSGVPDVPGVSDASDVSDDDIVVTVDGDDRLAHTCVLADVAARYLDAPRIWMTWGSYVYDLGLGLPARGLPRGDCAAPIEPEEYGRLRELPWRLSHLRTWKVWLWSRIDPRSLRDPSTGWYWPAAGDLFFMGAMAELAGPAHSRYVPSVQYVYNAANPLSEVAARRDEVARCADAWRAQAPHRPIESEG